MGKMRVRNSLKMDCVDVFENHTKKKAGKPSK